ncbi:hypothetical protein [Phyllobacterium lublinensis]|nr:hypothetical protein [Phyllobacterium sp. 2063]
MKPRSAEHVAQLSVYAPANRTYRQILLCPEVDVATDMPEVEVA